MIISKTDTPHDLKICADIWLDASIIAHSFIDAEFWLGNRIAMQEQYLPTSEVFIAKDHEAILGFAAMRQKTLAALFVKPANWGLGTGSALLHHAQKLYTDLALTVYKENVRAVHFYQNHGFSVQQGQICPHTGQPELLMVWPGNPTTTLTRSKLNLGR